MNNQTLKILLLAMKRSNYRSLSRLLTFLQANADNLLTATVTGEQKEGGWSCRTGKVYERLKNAKILKRELNERASRYTYFELKNIIIDQNKFPLLV